jgi:hypothetical protein
MARRNSEVELCFDSMTDLITNLAGGLILVVLLLLGVSREASRLSDDRPTGTAGNKKEGEKSIRPLSQRLNDVRADTERVDADINADMQLLQELNRKAEKLLERSKTNSGQTPDKK